MDRETFGKIINKQVDQCVETLGWKDNEYCKCSEDVLHAIKSAADLQGIPTKRALAGMMAKHTISIYNMCASGRYSEELWTEKITDHINYLLLLKAAAMEENEG